MIIRPEDFKQIEEIRLNQGGKIIGHLVKYKGLYFYLSPRRPEHFFIKFNGFGIDAALLNSFIGKKFQTELQKKRGITAEIAGVIIHYRGKREDRYYFANLDAWFLKSIPYGTAKIAKTGETYGQQKILNKNEMVIFGYGENDMEVLEQRAKADSWKKYEMK